MEKEQFWTQYAENFGALNIYVVGEATTQIVVERVAKLKDLGNVLELACGDGFYTKILADNSQHIMATDYSEEMVTSAKAKLSALDNVEFEQADAMALKFDNATFDTIFMANLLHIVSDYEIIVENAYKALKPNGRIIALDYTFAGMTDEEQTKLKNRFVETYGLPDKVAKKGMFTAEDMSSLFENKGFKTISSDLIGSDTKAVLAVGLKI